MNESFVWFFVGYALALFNSWVISTYRQKPLEGYKVTRRGVFTVIEKDDQA